MNREIKFRAWCNGAMYYVEHLMYLTYGDDEFNVTLVGDLFIDGIRLPQETIETNGSEVELMQFTGLIDKNEKEIYEGDILRFYSQSRIDSLAGKPLLERVCEILWSNDELCWWVRDHAGEGFKPEYCTDNKEFEIIGNIHKNPELLCQLLQSE